MGRASRKSASSAGPREHWTDTHPDRKMWSPGRLAIARTQTQEEYEALYGRSVSPEKKPASLHSPFFPGLAELPDPYTSESRLDLISGMDVPDDTDFNLICQDPVLRALWRAECQRVRSDRQQYERDFSGDHWSDGVADLEDTWQNTVVRSWFWGSGNNVIGWEPGLDARQHAKQLPSSFLAAAIEANPLVAERLADNMKALRSSPPLANDHFEKTILPEARYLSRPDCAPGLQHVLGPALAREIWEGARLFSDTGGSDIALAGNLLLDIVERGGGDRDSLQSVPLAPIDSGWDHIFGQRAIHKYNVRVNPTPYMEAVHRINWNKFEKDPHQALLDAATNVFVQQVTRVYYGLDTPKEELGVVTGWDRYRKDLQGVFSSRKARSPLENLRPIFRGEGKEELLEKLIESYKRQEGTPPVAQKLQRHFVLPRALQGTISEEIYHALS